MKLAMLGLWHTHATGIVQRVKEHPDEFELIGFFDPDPNVMRQRTEEWKSLVPMKVVGSPDELFSLKPDGVVVDGQVYENVGLARLALEAGFPVMLEKPAGADLKAFEQVIDLARRKHLHVQMIYLFRYMSAVLEMLRCAKEGEIGRIHEFRGRLPKDIRTYDNYVETMGWHPGGIFYEMAGHLVDMMITILGKPTRVVPMLSHHADRPGDFVDNGIAVFEFPHAYGIVEVPALEVAPRSRRIEAHGDRGSCVIPHLGSGHLGNREVQPIEIYRLGKGDWVHTDLPAAKLQIADLREFAAVVGGKKAPDYSFEHDLLVHEWLLKASERQ
ncbi:MAG: Gfo/Idh/MocA family oxidoreductase [Planctomycetota bacterium]